jgi:hypothetical protein
LNDVVKIADTLEESVETRRCVERRSQRNPDYRFGKQPATRVSRFARDVYDFIGVKSQSTWIALLCLTSASFAVMVAWLLFDGADPERPSVAMDAKSLPTYVARLTKSRQVQWGRGQRSLPTQSRLESGQRLAISAGVVEITFDSGATAAIEGPAEFEVRSPNEAFLHNGRVLASVPPAASGFAIQTDGMRIVDLGTQFGIDVDAHHNSSVHVLTGIVEAYLSANADSAQPVRVDANRAIRYDAVAKSLGQVPLDRSRFDEIENRLTRPLITEIQASSGKSYRIVPGGLQEDVLAYTDRNYEWNGIDSAGIPPQLRGADYVLTSNDDDLDLDYELRITVAEPATVYVLFDNRARPPVWLTRDFVDTGADIGLDTGLTHEEFAKGAGRSIDVQFSVWKRHVEAGTTKCGPTNQPNVAHYGVAVVANHE